MLSDALRDNPALGPRGLRAFLNHSPFIAFFKHPDGRYVCVNSTESDKGVSGDVSAAEFASLPEELAARIHVTDDELLRTRQPQEITEAVVAADGTLRRWRVTTFVFDDEHGTPTVGGIARDLTAQMETDARLQQSEERYRRLIDHSQGLICTHDLAGRILSANPASLRSIGLSADEVIGRSLDEFLAAETRHLFPLYLERIAATGQDSGLLLVTQKSGEIRTWQYHNVVVEELAGTRYVLGHAQDVTEFRIAQDHLRKLASTDDLTGLLNRRGFFSKAGRLLSTWDAATVFYADIDGLKRINDVHGHDAGSDVICAAAEALCHTFRAADVVARIGGDEFVVLAQLPHDAASVIVQRLQRHIEALNARATAPSALAMSVGTSAFVASDPLTLEELICLADEDMYRHKRAQP